MSVGTYLKRMIKYVIKGVPDVHTTVTVVNTSPSNILQGRNIVVTGGGRGLGFYIARRCVAEGANVLITGRNEDTLRDATQKIGKKCQYSVFDVQNVSGIPEFIATAEKKLENPIDSLVSNAGVSLHEGNFRNVTEDGWNAQMDTNLKGNFFLVREFIRYFEQQPKKYGNIVVISSERAKRSDDIPYGLTKTATNSFIQAMAQQVIGEGIRINGVAPGVTASDMTGVEREGNMYAEWQSGKRFFLPEEVAEVVNFLLGDASACIAGEIITCDQGRYISRW